MITIEHKYSPSVNIVTDNDVCDYIATPNANQIFNQLIGDYMVGIRSFNIVGDYGSGKSSFLWALEKNLNKKRTDFEGLNGQFKDVESFKYFPIIGKYGSLIETISEELSFNSKEPEKLIDRLNNECSNLSKSKKGLFLVIDEFGKFLEFASKNEPEKELYFIQQLAEFFNNSRRNALFVTALHQDFNAYAFGLAKSQRQEWNKVKGRLKEVTFNEPVEQLLLLASERLSAAKTKLQKPKGFSRLLRSIKLANAYPLRDYCDARFTKKLLPLDILSAAILTSALQRYGQNERSLFSFLESNDYLGIKDYNNKANPYYNLSCIYDYLLHNYYSFITTKYNPHYAQWAAIRTSIERAEGVLEENAECAKKLIKSIGLLNIFASGAAKIDKDFLSNYGKYALGVDSPEQIINFLVSNKIIRFVKHSHKYILFEGTDLDIELEIDKASDLISPVNNVSDSLNNYFDFPYIPAKFIYYKKGTPRFFAFKLSDKPIQISPEAEIDGFINLIFSDVLQESDVKKESRNSQEAILYGFYKNTDRIKEIIREIERVKHVRDNNLEDKVAQRELDSILRHELFLLNNEVINSLYSSNSPIVWYFKGKELEIKGRKTFNVKLSDICNEIYSKSPIFKNEMVNRTKLSSSISTARRRLLKLLVDSHRVKNLGMTEERFPPEKAIYLSLLEHTGIHRNDNKSESTYIIDNPTKKGSFEPLWNEGMRFLNSAEDKNRNLHELVSIYSKRPYKLKKGLIDFFLPIFLFAKRDNFALFNDSVYVPYLNEDVLELIIKKPKNFEVKTFNMTGSRLDLFNKYRNALNKVPSDQLSNQAFIETIRPFLSLYRGLPEYAKKTKNLSKKSLALRDAIANSKSPEIAFYEEFPSALDYSLTKLLTNYNELESYIFELNERVKEIKVSYDQLVNRIEKFIVTEIIGTDERFPDYKVRLKGRYKQLKVTMLLEHQKVFYQRLLSDLNDRESWLNSISYACTSKTLNTYDDKDEYKFYELFSNVISELDNLCEISESDVDPEQEDIYRIEITSFLQGLQRKLVRLPKTKDKYISNLENKIKKVLDKDKRVNTVILTKLLQEQIKDEK